MLRIEKIFIQGFKSFCDPTEIVFDEEGITAVVGPNGCGKSNVADAISWVIGEQRAKALRGGKMEDVIFQGSRNRQPSGMAEVQLTMVVHETFEIRGDVRQPESEALKLAQESLDQADAAIEASAAEIEEKPLETQPAEGSEQPVQADAPLPDKHRKFRRRQIDGAPRIFAEGERVTVGRRLYRTGESEYEMNGRLCRLRDVQDLFAGTGLGGAHYAIIEQGRIGQILSAKPMDRRALIEEAAGISKFKMRQHAAELKLEASRNNLSRITDILTEIERQQNSLKRQASKARRYRRLRQEMRDLMRAVYVVDYRTSKETIGRIQDLLDEIVSRSGEMATRIAELDAAQTEAAQAARSAEEALNRTRQEAATIDIETERASQQHSYLKEQLQSLGTRAAQFARDEATTGERRQFIDQESQRLREQLVLLEDEINSHSKSLNEAETAHRHQIERDNETERRLEEARKTSYESVTTMERWRQLTRQFTEAVDRSRTRLEGLRAERERAGSQSQVAEDQFAQLSASLDETTARHERIGGELTEVAGRLEELRRRRDDRQNSMAQAGRDLASVEHRLHSLSELDRQRAYYSEAVQALMKRDPALNGFKTLGTLADYVQVSPDNETLIDVALRDELQYVVVPTFDDALGAIDFLKSEGAGRATFLVIGLHGTDSAATGQNGGGDGGRTLDSLLGLRPEFAEAFKLALPALANAHIVEDTAQAIKHSSHINGSSSNGSRNGHSNGLTTLALTGERVIAGRLISGGSRAESSMGVLALKREIGELTERLEAMTALVLAGETELDGIRSQITADEESHQHLDAELRQVDKKLAVLREQMQQCERERERTSTHIRVVEGEIAQAETELKEAEGKLEHASTQLAESEKLRAEAGQAVEVAQAEVAEMRRNAEQRAQDLSRRRAEFAAQTERRRGLQNDISRLRNESADLENRLNSARMEAIAAREQAAATETNISSTGEQLEQLTARQQSMGAEIEERNRALTEVRRRVEEIELQLRGLRETSSQTREERAQKEIELARLSSNVEHLLQICHAELGENLVEVCERLDQQQQMVSDERPDQQVAVERPERAIDADPDSEDYDLEEDREISFWTVPEHFDLTVAKGRLEELRARIDGLGPVNMMALEELVEIEERFQFLSIQKSDIEKAIVDTQAAIAEIKRRSKERFIEAFHAVNGNFREMFTELFGGGHGEMRLIDETDILESGIEIIAQPPGKRLQNVLLLSGGEKAMTALALVMAIFRYRPSPFCLLDEVDAPLDEVNIGRFAEKVIEMSAKTQFMIITHSKRTMEAANTLYGVTMEDPGVSKLISVKLTN
ncbi:MAG: chromosome segregation protein SMC [Acidobacteriota bacterium]|nr:MAG: chromosome segregation protein SMC [Acidobacteriota bacterium]